MAPASADPFPTAPSNIEPFPGPAAEPAPDSPSPPPPVAELADEPPPAPADHAENPRPARKRAPRKSVDEAPEPTEPNLSQEFTLVSDDPPVTESDAVESVMSSDGATRLIATAYIGIGNRLFIRGDGPGLSWDKGAPLQFVSIGKWRWETSEATGPISFKLYKNDEVECSTLGSLTLEPGHQQEVTAKF